MVSKSLVLASCAVILALADVTSLNDLADATKKAANDLSDQASQATQDAANHAQATVNKGLTQAQDTVNKGLSQGQDAVNTGLKSASEQTSQAQDTVNKGLSDAQDTVNKGMRGFSDQASEAANQAQDAVNKGLQGVAAQTAEAAHVQSSVKACAGHVTMNVQKNGRRLQEVTGFADDSQAKKAVASAIESKCSPNCKSKVHTYDSERQGTATSERRLLSASGVVDVNYTVDCDDSTDCQLIWAKLNGVQPSDLTTAVVAELQAGNITEYTVEVENHLVDQVPCAIFGVAYNDPFRNDYLNGAVVASAYDCQRKCMNTLYCYYFSWYKNSGGCWLQGNYSKLSVAGSSAEKFAISGPVVCKELPAWAQPEVAMKQDGVSADEALGAAPASSGGPGWIPWAVGAAAVAAAGGIGYYAYSSSGDDKKKSKKTRGIKTKKELPKSMDEVSPLTSEPTPAVQMSQMPAYNAAQPMQYQQYQVPQQQYYNGSMQPMPMAQPMATATPQVSPVAAAQYYMPQ